MTTVFWDGDPYVINQDGEPVDPHNHHAEQVPS